MNEEEPNPPPRQEIAIPVENIVIPLFFILCLAVAYFGLRAALGGRWALWLFAPIGLLIPILLVGIGNLIMGLSARLKKEK